MGSTGNGFSGSGRDAESLVRAVLGADRRLQRRLLAAALEIERDQVAGLESEEDRRIPLHVLEVLAVDREQQVALFQAGLLRGAARGDARELDALPVEAVVRHDPEV